eukprot:Gregarina_sp_Poly_1__7185@NODE_3940_length_815_cov_16_929144_g2551_i0_p1_GENE_NODE_3940_length_815_cov_16_929144_g2551_i0NODE_3940_length_815_cov_16_929144_g2551_i0_p1_ORF_typecomplete_len204_score4_84_NODE_3940_length_815_cov_16_929144_g2551_i090701
MKRYIIAIVASTCEVLAALTIPFSFIVSIFSSNPEHQDVTDWNPSWDHTSTPRPLFFSSLRPYITASTRSKFLSLPESSHLAPSRPSDGYKPIPPIPHFETYRPGSLPEPFPVHIQPAAPPAYLPPYQSSDVRDIVYSTSELQEKLDSPTKSSEPNRKISVNNIKSSESFREPANNLYGGSLDRPLTNVYQPVDIVWKLDNYR